jgi:hypothetical protein
MTPLLVLAGCFGGTEAPAPPAPPKPAYPDLKTPGVLPLPPPAPGDPAPAIGPDNCDDLTDGGPLAGPDCITGTIACGQTVVGHTKGGSAAFDTKFYEAQFCTPALTDHSSGDERVYVLELPPGDRNAKVWLDTPCADLDLAAIRVPDATTCPNATSSIKQCEMSVQPNQKRDKVEIVSQVGTTWLIVVEGKGNAEGAFALTVACADGLH